MRRRTCLRASLGAGSALLMAGSLTACGSPPAHRYLLAAVPGALNGSGPPIIGVRDIGIPGYLDQDNIAKTGGDYQLTTFDNDLWAEPLSDMLRATMVENLAQRLPHSTVIGSGGAIAAPSDVLVEINVLQFGPDAAGRIALSAQIAVKSGRNRVLWLSRPFEASAASAGTGAPGIVATMSAMWAETADLVTRLAVEGWVSHASS